MESLNLIVSMTAKDAIIEQLQKDNDTLIKELEQLKSENDKLKCENEQLKRALNMNDENGVLIKNNDNICVGLYYETDDDISEVRRSKRRRGKPKRLIDTSIADRTKKLMDRESRPRGRPRKHPLPEVQWRINDANGPTIDDIHLESDDIKNIAKIDNNNDDHDDDDDVDEDGDDEDEDDNDNTDINKLRTENSENVQITRFKHPHSCDWPGCDRSFRRPAFLRKHKRVHTGEKPFKCEYSNCNYRTGDIFCLRTHQLRHTGEKPFKCKVSGCGWSGRQQTSLDRHKRVFHAESTARPYICDWPGCDRRYRDKHSLNYHSKSHTGEKEFMCSFSGCGKRFIGRSDMKKHETTHTNNKPHKCSWPGCGRSFVQKRALNVHNLKHTGERPYACDWPGCEWRSFTPHESAKHKKTHTGERPFPCDRCERRFADESNLKAHQRVVHDGEKRHVCEYPGCGKRYTVRRTLLIHRMRSHMISD